MEAGIRRKIWQYFLIFYNSKTGSGSIFTQDPGPGMKHRCKENSAFNYREGRDAAEENLHVCVVTYSPLPCLYSII
jgi:hypothetical protein